MGKHKKHRKKTKKHKRHSSSSSSSECEWVESNNSKKDKKRHSVSSDDETQSKHKQAAPDKPGSSTFNERDEWMGIPTIFTSTSTGERQDRREKDRKEKAESEKYNPGKNIRELNPYWKDGGDGLPKFARPKYDSSDDDNTPYISKNKAKMSSSWKKQRDTSPREKGSRDRCNYTPERKEYKDAKRDYTPEKKYKDTKRNSYCDREQRKEKEDALTEESRKSSALPTDSENHILTEKELNLLAGKLVKAEIMGNTKLVEELKLKLENARNAIQRAKSHEISEEVLLTHTDNKGRSQPVKLKCEHEEPSGRKQKRIKTETHNKNNERVRYFADDDKYSLKQMFEEEKYGDSHRQERDFVELAGKVKKNDDLDDLFTDEVRRTKSDSKINASNRDKAIKEHEKIAKALDNCDRCIQSESSLKHLIVSMGEYVYLGLPAREPLIEGHCIIVPIRHVSCSTALDENEWSEIMDFRRALLKCFKTKNMEPIFFECAMYFHKQPHMILECIPVYQEDNMAPIYFKKAIDESETEWAQNKKLVSLEGRDVRRAIPKGLPYFFVSFGLKEGYAHVIEDEKMFPKNFASEIIGGMLDLHHNKWRNPKRESFSDQSKRVLKFSFEWKPFDCTNRT